MGKNFDQIVREEFEFLLQEHGFSTIAKCEKVADGYEILFTNRTTGVRLNYEFREAYVFVTIYRLINGKFVENPNPIKPESVMHGFSLDDIIAVQNPEAMVKPAYQYGTNSVYYDP